MYVGRANVSVLALQKLKGWGSVRAISYPNRRIID
jgi:hypothetical protein